MDARLGVAIVADDLTGALDTAAPFASVGFATRLLLDPSAAGGMMDDVAVLATTTESRQVGAGVAALRVDSAVRAIAAHAPRIVFKKIDSALRGNVAAEIEAAMRASGRRHAWVCPAVPRLGRTLRDGEVLIGGVPLHQTPFGRDALSPPPRERLTTILRAQCRDMAVHGLRPEAFRSLSVAPGLHAYVVDAESDADLGAIARFAVANARDALVVGAAGLGLAIADALRESRARTPSHEPAAPPAGPALFIVGSRTSISAAQVAELRRAGANELLLPVNATDREIEDTVRRMRGGADAGTSSNTWVIRPDASPGAEASAASVARKLGLAAACAVEELQPSTLAIVGGDTAFATFAALGVREAIVSGELEPGIAFGRITVNDRPLAFVTKSGGFGDADALARVARRIGMTAAAVS